MYVNMCAFIFIFMYSRRYVRMDVDLLNIYMIVCVYVILWVHMYLCIHECVYFGTYV